MSHFSKFLWSWRESNPQYRRARAGLSRLTTAPYFVLFTTQVFKQNIPHFIHTPFYVYAYSFGDCLVNSLYSIYEKDEIPNFQDKYFEMLKAGGSLHHKELLKPFNLDITKEDFWQKGLNVLIKLIDELEKC